MVSGPAALLFAIFLFAMPNSVQARELERRPCVAPDSPHNCDAVPGAPSPNGAFSSGVPSPDRARLKSIVKVPLQKTPEQPTVPPDPEGTVTVKPVPPGTPPNAPMVPLPQR